MKSADHDARETHGKYQYYLLQNLWVAEDSEKIILDNPLSMKQKWNLFFFLNFLIFMADGVLTAYYK